MSSNTRNIKTYRPYLTHPEILEIMSLLPPTSPIYTKLKLFEFKITNDLTSPARITKPVLSALEKLGGSSPEEARYLAGEMSAEEEEQYLNNLMGIGSTTPENKGG